MNGMESIIGSNPILNTMGLGVLGAPSSIGGASVPVSILYATRAKTSREIKPIATSIANLKPDTV
jgi:hypothetical protein